MQLGSYAGVPVVAFAAFDHNNTNNMPSSTNTNTGTHSQKSPLSDASVVGVGRHLTYSTGSQTSTSSPVSQPTNALEHAGVSRSASTKKPGFPACSCHRKANLPYPNHLPVCSPVGPPTSLGLRGPVNPGLRGTCYIHEPYSGYRNHLISGLDPDTLQVSLSGIYKYLSIGRFTINGQASIQYKHPVWLGCSIDFITEDRKRMTVLAAGFGSTA